MPESFEALEGSFGHLGLLFGTGLHVIHEDGHRAPCGLDALVTDGGMETKLSRWDQAHLSRCGQKILGDMILWVKRDCRGR